MQQRASQATLPAKSTSSAAPIPGTNMVMLAGRHQKPTPGPLVIEITDSPFAAAPFVTISPFWNGAGGAVGSIDTITDIQPDAFTVTSQNAAQNFYIDWIAVGKPAP
jgi:hypothetical protein